MSLKPCISNIISSIYRPRAKSIIRCLPKKTNPYFKHNNRFNCNNSNILSTKRNYGYTPMYYSQRYIQRIHTISDIQKREIHSKADIISDYVSKIETQIKIAQDFLLQNKYEQASEAYFRAVTISKDYASTVPLPFEYYKKLSYLAVISFQGVNSRILLKESIHLLQRLKTMDPGAYSARLLEAKTMYQLKDYNRVIEILNGYIFEDPEALELRAKSLYHTRQFRKAYQAFQLMNQRYPNLQNTLKEIECLANFSTRPEVFNALKAIIIKEEADYKLKRERKELFDNGDDADDYIYEALDWEIKNLEKRNMSTIDLIEEEIKQIPLKRDSEDVYDVGIIPMSFHALIHDESLLYILQTYAYVYELYDEPQAAIKYLLLGKKAFPDRVNIDLYRLYSNIEEYDEANYYLDQFYKFELRCNIGMTPLDIAHVQFDRKNYEFAALWSLKSVIDNPCKKGFALLTKSFMGLRRYDQAVLAAKAVIKFLKERNDDETGLQSAELLYLFCAVENGMYQEAEDYIKTLPIEKQELPFLIHMRLKILEKQGMTDLCLEKINSLPTMTMELFCMKGRLLFKKGLLKEAESCFFQGGVHEFKNLEPILGLARVYNKMGNYGDAYDLLSLHPSDDINDPSFWVVFGESCLGISDTQGALKSLKACENIIRRYECLSEDKEFMMSVNELEKKLMKKLFWYNKEEKYIQAKSPRW